MKGGQTKQEVEKSQGTKKDQVGQRSWFPSAALIFFPLRMPLFGPRTPTTPRSASLRSSGRPIGGTEIERAKELNKLKGVGKGTIGYKFASSVDAQMLNAHTLMSHSREPTLRVE